MPTGVETNTVKPTIIKLPTIALRKPPPSVPGAGVSLVSKLAASASVRATISLTIIRTP